jgi:hypothetical protein
MAANAPAVFTPTQVVLRQGSDASVIIDRRTLAFQHTFMGNIDPEYSGQCTIVTAQDRKF